MEYEVKKVQFRLFGANAKITTHIRYADATQLYESVLSEFLRSIVSSAFAGETPDIEDNETILAELLMKKYEELPEQYAETEITYPLTHTGDGWKIDSLDEQTVKVMSANFKNIEDEIDKVLNPDAEDSDGSTEQGAASERNVVNLTGTDALSVQTDRYRLQFSSFIQSKDVAGKDCLLYFYTYTNLSDTPSSAMVDVKLQAFQEGTTLAEAIPNENDPALDHRFSEVAPGESLLVCEAFELPQQGNVSIQTTDQQGNVVSQILRLQ